MTTEDAIRAELRLVALETLVTLLWCQGHLASGKPKESLEALEKTLLARARGTGFSGVGPAYSDLASAELEAAVASALQSQRDFLRSRIE